MIYISAQPDELYFIWQLKVMAHNFIEVGVPPSSIQILLAYDKMKGLSEEALLFIKQAQVSGITVFSYPDERKSSNYASSIRPNILKQHFKKYKYLSNELLFYHDCDIVFREKIDTLKLDSNTWYVSDAQSYLSSKYIKEFSENVFEAMCEIVNINPAEVITNDNNAGGAQYILSDIEYGFWEKIEEDSEKLFSYLEQVNAKLKAKNGRRIQAWCADMWAILWNGIKLKKNVQISKELDFCWPSQNLKEWENVKILHNAGVTIELSHNLFCKLLYRHYSPFFDNLNHIDKDKCTIKYVEQINKYLQTIKKSNLLDVTFIYVTRIDSTDRTQNLDLTVRYILKKFLTNIIVLEADDIPKINSSLFSKEVKYHFFEDKRTFLHKTTYYNRGIRLSKTPFICLMSTDVIPSNMSIEGVIQKLRKCEINFGIPHNGVVKNIKRDKLQNFLRSLDYEDLSNVSKSTEHLFNNSFGKAFFLNKNQYLKYGLENEKILLALDGEERVRRLKILGEAVYRAGENLWHIDHYTNMVKSKQEQEAYLMSADEFIKTCYKD